MNAYLQNILNKEGQILNKIVGNVVKRLKMPIANNWQSTGDEIGYESNTIWNIVHMDTEQLQNYRPTTWQTQWCREKRAQRRKRS